MTTTTTGNRITAAIGRYQARIDGFGGEDAVGLNGKRIGDMHADMALSFQEFFAFQNAQARAHASGKLSSDEAMTCLLYTSPSPRDGLLSRMPSSA